IGFSPQVMTSEPSGLNVAMFLDAAWNDSLQSRFTLGVGELDFYTGASLKYIPFPDVARQPAIGLKASIWHARIESDNLTTLHLAPMVSKKFQTEKQGLWIPYAAIGLSSYELAGKSKSGLQFMVGSDWKAPDLPEYTFTGEIALDVDDSVGHMALSIAIPFNEKSGF
ncbi:MAG: hypothetical protein ACK5V3_18500, partial [Bdellovibrionales bacterium]